MSKISSIVRMGDVETEYGFVGAAGVPVIAVFMSLLLLLSSFGVMASTQPPEKAFQKAQMALAEESKRMDSRNLVSFYHTHDGTVEARLVLRSANSGVIFYLPIVQAVFMTISGIACVVGGAATALKLLKGTIATAEQIDSFAKTYSFFRYFAWFTSWLCSLYILYAIWTIGLWPAISRFLEPANAV